MEHVVTRDFSISRDFKSIAWAQTIWLNALRASCAGLVMMTLVLLGGKDIGNVGTIMAMPVIFPIVYLLFYLPLGLICAFLSRFLPFVGLITIVVAIFFVVAGDPIVWILSLVIPRMVPIAKPGFANFVLITWVLKPENVVELTVTNQ